MAERLVCEEIEGAKGRGFLVKSTASLAWDDPEAATGTPIADLVQRVVERPPKRFVIHVHGYNNPVDVARERAKKAWDGYFASSSGDTFYVAFVWPSEKGLWPTRIPWSLWSLPAFPLLLVIVGLAFLFVPRIWPVGHDAGWWLAGGLLMGFVGYLAFLRYTAYYRDQYRATQYGVPDLVETVRVLDEALKKGGVSPHSVDLSFLGHSMGAFVVTSAVRILVDSLAPPPSDKPLSDPVERGQLSEIGSSLRLSNLVLVSPDIPVQAIVSPRLNFLAESLSRFRGRFLFTNVGDVVLDPISTAANCPVVPVWRDKRNARLGNLAVLPGKVRCGFFEAVDLPTYTARLRTPNGPLEKLIAPVGGKPIVPIQAENAFMVFDCTAVRGPRLSLFGGTQLRLPLRLLMLLSYVAKVLTKLIGQDCHSGYFDHADLVRALFGAVETGKPDLGRDPDLETWACRVDVRAIALAEERQVVRALAEQAQAQPASAT